MRVFLDDEREAPTGLIHVYWPDEVVELLKIGKVIEVSL